MGIGDLRKHARPFHIQSKVEALLTDPITLDVTRRAGTVPSTGIIQQYTGIGDRSWQGTLPHCRLAACFAHLMQPHWQLG
jgi:hypothetical protein